MLLCCIKKVAAAKEEQDEKTVFQGAASVVSWVECNGMVWNGTLAAGCEKLKANVNSERVAFVVTEMKMKLNTMTTTAMVGNSSSCGGGSGGGWNLIQN